MEQNLNRDDVVVRYLLGDLPEPDRQELIDNYLTDDTLYQRMLTVEEDLIDDYVRGRLSPRAREQFEKCYLMQPQQRLRVRDAAAFLASVSRANRVSRWQWLRELFRIQNPVLVYSLAAATILALLGGSWLLKETTRLREHVSQSEKKSAVALQREQELKDQISERTGQNSRLSEDLRQVREQLRSAESEKSMLQKQAQEGRAQQSHSRVSGLELAANLGDVRGPAKTLFLIPGRDLVQLTLRLKSDDYSSYRALLYTAEREEVLSQAGLKAQSDGSGKAVIVNFSADHLSNRDYILTLEGKTVTGSFVEVDRWPLRVLRR